MSPSTPHTASDFLDGAVDLSRLVPAGQAPARSAAHAGHTAEGAGAPNEFRIAIVGDADGNPKVMLAFGHLRWMFDPELAKDLGSVLVEAAAQATCIPATADPSQASLSTLAPTAGEMP